MIQYLWENVLKKKSSENNVLSFLKNSFLFKDLTSTEMEFLAHIVHVRYFEPGGKDLPARRPGSWHVPYL